MNFKTHFLLSEAINKTANDATMRAVTASVSLER